MGTPSAYNPGGTTVRQGGTCRTVSVVGEELPPCNVDADCGEMEICEDGDCFPVECIHDGHCDDDAVCQANVCTNPSGRMDRSELVKLGLLGVGSFAVWTYIQHREF